MVGHAALPAAALALLTAASCPAPASARAVRLEGSWYVLVHYRDARAAHPEAPRFEDRLWVFARKGSRLHWAEYPIVVFADESGRFERRPNGQVARALHFWEPQAGQRADIRDGLDVSERGAKREILRGSDAEGWSSQSRPRPASASVITYDETWTIERLPGEPVFTQLDVLGSGRSDSLRGVTRYTTTRVLPGGDRLEGRFERDGARVGTFRMMRSGAPPGQPEP